MYYSNISNKDLLPFHHTLLPNMAITLQETLNNDLFYIEEVGEFLKIIPLFNTTSISSNNPSDKILDNKCIIAQNKPSTYLTFKSNTDDETEEYVPYSDYYSIGDKLNTAQFNGIVQLIRNHIKNNDNLTLKQGLNNGDYGDYEINIDDATIVDNGILITEETLQNTNTITLTNPSFYYSRYILTLTVLEYATPGIGDNTRPETITSTIEIELNKEEPTILPFDDLTVGSVVLFESEVQIDHSTPYIAGWVVDHVDMLESGPIQKGDTGVLSALVSDRNDVGIMGMEVSFYEEYILSIICKLSSLIIEKDDTCVVSAELRDSKDGSHVALAGETVLFYLSKGYYPLLDKATVSCESTGANYCYSIGLDDLGLDLSSTDFKLEFDYKNTVNGGRLCIGARDSWSSGAGAGNNYLYIGTSAANNGGYGVKYNGSTSNTSIGPVSAGTVLHCIIIRQDSTVSYYIDGELKGTKTAEWISDVTDWSIYLQCWGTGDYTVENLVLDVEPDLSQISLSVSGNSDVLSYADSESCTLTATVLDGDDEPLVGETVSMRVYQGSTLVDTLTVADNSDGTYTGVYASQGVGDVSVVVECRNLQETYTIEDCLISLLPETTITNSSGTKISSIGLDTIPNIQNTDFILSFEHKGNGTLSIGSKNNWSSSSANYRLTLGYADNKHYYSVRTTSTTEGYGSSASTSTNYGYSIVREGTSISFYQGETLISTKTASFLSNYSTWSIYSLIWGSATSVFKNIKLKPL